MIVTQGTEKGVGVISAQYQIQLQVSCMLSSELLVNILLPQFFRWILCLHSNLCSLKRVCWKDKSKPYLQHQQHSQVLVHRLPFLLPKYFTLTDMAAQVLVPDPFTSLETYSQQECLPCQYLVLDP